jgi:hypothetical protein
LGGALIIMTLRLRTMGQLTVVGAVWAWNGCVLGCGHWFPEVHH